MKTNTESFFDKITKAFNAELPFAVYRHPKTDEIKGVFQKDDDLHYTKDFSESGFVFAPFDDRNAAILLPFTTSIIYSATFSDTDVAFTDDSKELEHSSQHINAEQTHIDLVRKGIDFLNREGLKKVVLSRKEIIDCPDFDVIDSFKKLLKFYKNATVYMWFHPKIGLWLGATPETLLNVDKDIFKTMALAGTQPYQGSLNVVWHEKEQQEQQYVTDFIIEKLQKSLLEDTKNFEGEINNIKVSDPYTIKAGSLVHICTDISGRLSKEFSLTELIKTLHPTPAVCGLPKAESKSFILENEAYDREFYTGFFGELNIENTSSLFVNLRCMKVLTKQLAIYIGGGITLDSDPVKEWEETVAKSRVMLKVLN